MNRRSFLKRIAAAVVTAVAAPIIIREAIARELPVAREPYWYQTTRVSVFYSDEYRAEMKRILTTSHVAREIAAGRTCPFYE